jgi:hypothetical protein
VHHVAIRSSVPASIRRPHPAIDRKPLEAPAACGQSAAIDNAPQPEQVPLMNNPLPRACVATRFSAVLAAAFVALATLATIDRLAAAEAVAPEVAQIGAAQPA